MACMSGLAQLIPWVCNLPNCMPLYGGAAFYFSLACFIQLSSGQDAPERRLRAQFQLWAAMQPENSFPELFLR